MKKTIKLEAWENPRGEIQFYRENTPVHLFFGALYERNADFDMVKEIDVPYEQNDNTYPAEALEMIYANGLRAGYQKAIEELRGDDADKFWREHTRCMHLGWADFLESKIDEVLR